MADRKVIVLNSSGYQELLQGSDKLILDAASEFKSNVHIDGNLTVTGTSVTFDTVTLTVDDINIELGAIKEVHNIAVTPENLAYTLSDGSNSVTTSALGASPTIATLVTAIEAASGYSSLDFTVTANINNNGIHLTYKTLGAQSESATLTKAGGSPISATVVTNVSDASASGGGFTLYGTTPKTFNWINSTGSWTSSENINLASGKDYKINGTSVLTNNTLGSGVTASSLTSVGTITTGTWNGTAIGQAYGGTGHSSYSNGQLLIGKADGTLGKAFLTQGTNTVITNGDGSIEIVAKDTTYTISAEQTGGSDADPDIKITAGGNGSTVASTVALVGGGGTTVTRNSASQITISSAGDQSISATQTGDRVDIELSNNGGSVALVGGTATTVTRTSSSMITINGQDTTYSAATTSAAGLMSATDKTQLDALHAGSNVNYLRSNASDDFTGTLAHNNPGDVALYVRGGDSDTTLLRVSSQAADGTTTDTSGLNGFSLVYKGTGSNNNNSLDLYSDNQSAQAQTHVYSVTQDGVLDFKVAPTISSNSVLTSATTFGGDVSGTYNAIVVADNSHDHTIANITSLATTLAGKYATSGGTLSGQVTIDVGQTEQPLVIEGGANEKIALKEALEPRIVFYENTTEKAHLKWSREGYLELKNAEDASVLRVKDALAFSMDGSTFYDVFHSGIDVDLSDSNKIKLGTGDELQIYHDGQYSTIKNTASGPPLAVISDTGIDFKNSSNTTFFDCSGSGGYEHVALKYGGSTKLSTVSAGVYVQGALTANNGVTPGGNITMQDNEKIIFGAGNDLQIWHDSSHTRIQNTNGDLNVRSDVITFTNAADTATRLTINSSGNAEFGGQIFADSANGAMQISRTNADYHIIRTGISSSIHPFVVLARGTTSIHHLYDNRDDAALNIGYFIASNNSTKRTAAFFTAKGTLYLGNSGNTTTSNFKTKLGEDGAAQLVGRVDVGGLTVDSNLTPTSGSSIEAFYNSGGYIQAYDRDSPGFTSLRIKSSNYELGSDGSATFGSSTNDQLILNPGSGSLDSDASKLTIQGRTNDGTAVAFEIKRQSSANSGDASTHKLKIDYAGNFGIGSDFVPAGANGATLGAIYKGAIIKGGDAAVGVRLESTAGSGGILEAFAEDGGVSFDTRGSGFIRFKSAGTEFLRFGSSGQIGLSGANYGTSGQVLTSNGSSSAPTWQNAGAGSGAGSDAGTLDGLDSSQFLRSDADDTMSGNLTIDSSSNWDAGNGMLNVGGTGDGRIQTRHIWGKSHTSAGTDNIWVQYNNNGKHVQIGGGNNHTNNLYIQGEVYKGYIGSGSVHWHAGNDGPGSLLDADKLDNQEGSFYLDYNNFIRTPTIPTNNNQLTNGAGYITSFDITTQTDSKYLRSDAADTFTGDLTGGQGANIVLHPNIGQPGSTAYSSMSGYLIFDNDYSDSARGPNKVRLQNDGSWLSGLGISSNSTDIYTGGNFNFYKSVSTTVYTHLLSLSSDATLTTKGKVVIDGSVAPNTLAYLNIGSSGSGETRAIDIDGAWSDNESKSISFTYSSGAADMVGQIQCVYQNPGSMIQFGRLYHSGNSSVYPLKLYSTSSTAAALSLNNNTVWHAGNDGAGSGLDADTLDGLNSGAWIRADANSNTDTNVKTRFGGQYITNQSGSSAVVQINGFSRIGALAMHRSANPTSGNGAPDADHEWLTNIGGVLRWGSNATTADNKIWHAGNDGSGSGLDADTLDGIQATSFLRSDAADTATGTITISGLGNSLIAQHDVTSGNWSGRIISKNATSDCAAFLASYNGFPGLYAHNNALNAWHDVFINSHGTGNGQASVYLGTSYINGNIAWHAGNDGAGSLLDADKLDNQEGSYYLNYSNFTNTPTIPTNNNQLTNGAGYITNGSNYNVNDDWFRENGDNAHVKIYGNSRQMVFRTDGETEFSSGVGAYAFAWMYGGDAAGNRRMLLDDTGDLWTSNNGWLSSALSGKAASSHSHSYAETSHTHSYAANVTYTQLPSGC